MHRRTHPLPFSAGCDARPIAFVLALLLLWAGFGQALPAQAQSPLPPRVYLPLALKGDAAASGPNVLDSITDAETAGRITPETAALYRLQALMGAPELPAEFATAPGGMPDVDGTALVGDVLERWNTFSAEGRRALAPYLMRPNAEGSRYRQGPPAASAANGSRAAAANPLQRPVQVVQVGAAANNRIMVWGTAANSPAALAVLKLLGERTADNVLGPIEKLFGRTWSGDTGTNFLWCDQGLNIICHEGDNLDARLDVYVVPLNTPGDTRGNNSAPTASFVVINENSTAEAREFAVWHELTHVIQFQFPIKQSWQSVKWWMESSANWSAVHFAPANRFAYDKHAPHLFKRPEDPLDTWSGKTSDQLHAYGAFLWPVVFDRILTGGTGGAVSSVWSKMADGLTPAAAIQNVLGNQYESAWREFVLANWNRVYMRRESGGTPAGYARYAPLLAAGDWPNGVPNAVLYQYDYDATGAPYRRFADLQPHVAHLAAAYVMVKVTPQTPQLLLMLDNWTTQSGARLDAFIRKDGEVWDNLSRSSLHDWKMPDGGTYNWRYFCRDMKASRAEEILLVFSNDSPTANLAATVPVAISNVGCRWKGTVSLTHRDTYAFPSLNPTSNGSDEYSARIAGVWRYQENPLDVCSEYPADTALNCPVSNTAFPHIMPVSNWGEQGSIEGSGKFTQIETGDCVSGYQYQFSAAYNDPNRLAIWGDRHNFFSFDVTYGLPAGVSPQPVAGCAYVVGPTNYSFQIGRPVEPLNMQPIYPSCVDQKRTVSADGTALRATWTLNQSGGLGQSSCGQQFDPGTGYEQWTWYEQVALDLQRVPEP